MAKMKAVVLHGPDNYPNNYEVMEIEKPTCGENEILLKMKAAALCGTDKRIFTGGKTKGVRPDSVVGHEICGIIEEVGANVKGYSVGDRVAVANVIPCGHCSACLSGRENACLNRKAIGYEFNGGFEEYILIPDICIESGNVVKLPDTVSYAAGALIEPLACCIRGLRNTGTGFNDTVLIIGAGPIGLMHLELSLIAGARKVIVSELDADKRELALKLGAARVVDSKNEDLHQIIMDETNGEGVDRIVMAIGVNALVDSTFKLAKKGGTVCLFAGFPKGKMSEFDPSVIHYNELNITGSTAYKRIDYLQAADMVKSGKIDLDAIVSQKFPIDDFRSALDLHMAGTALKVVIEN
ncbi:MAG: alcohol dehydrogenase catalytic domain-containing protein [Synergistales bacterium]|nr:alcohol dehydrogenase catalytic domain-containing protein [Synergistales bacterium]MDY6402190.1 alcohol dehydrogenase catalytic domain-containing protein [Synergistales bacterium]MDY6404138.1 alcohol dehydrogenase catalytic domain-containing protein [Synergistales bacterium]MDY6409758.1 alcohol dehydrogenase catalytic domain-containing protein [Synergistales bacterium]MDY6414175.1 alcohol dehydrogenase catalytic domain-containing protein [Synergistales bacterium]